MSVFKSGIDVHLYVVSRRYLSGELYISVVALSTPVAQVVGSPVKMGARVVDVLGEIFLDCGGLRGVQVALC